VLGAANRSSLGERWHLDHDDIDKTKYIGASH
jgi:hypothetical protein